MTIAKEHFGQNIIDENNDVRSKYDVTEGSVPPDNAFIIGRDYTLAQKRAREKQLDEDAYWDGIRSPDVGPHVSLERYYQDQLDLLDFVSGSLMRRGFKKAAPVDKTIQDRYGEDLPRVEAGAERNHKRSVHTELPRIYHADELIQAGFDADDVMFNAKTEMRVQAQQKYGGPQNKNKRAARRKELKAKRDLYRQ